MRICQVDNCEKKHEGRGLCAMHLARLRRHGDVHHVERDYSKRVYGLTDKERFLRRINKEAGCWNWDGHLLRGYGRFNVNGNSLLAHRAAYLLFKGEIPEGLEVDHNCGNRACVNPAHLDALTRKEHNRREVARRLENWDTCKAGLHPYPENRVLEPSTGRARCRECRREAQRRYKAKLRKTLS